MSQFKNIESLEIKCSNGVVLVDKEDWSFLSRYSWSLSNGYAITSFFLEEKRYSVSMHRMIMRMSQLHVDHINGVTTDKSSLEP